MNRSTKPMKKTLEIKLMIIENFIDHLGASDEHTGLMKTLALSYVEEDHVDEIAQAFPKLDNREFLDQLTLNKQP